MYGPMTGVGDLIFDKDAVYVKTTDKVNKNEVRSFLLVLRWSLVFLFTLIRINTKETPATEFEVFAFFSG